MKMRYIFAAAVVTCVACLSIGAQPSSTSQQDDIQPSKDYTCKGKGALAVFGTVLNSNQVSIKDGSIIVQLHRPKFTVETTEIDPNGRYCIRYEKGDPLSTLVFIPKGAKSDQRIKVQYIAGDRSHFINKVFYKDNPISYRTSLQDRRISSVRYSDAVSKLFYVFETDMLNTSGNDIIILASGFDLGKAERSQGTAILTQAGEILVPSVDPKVVAHVAVQKGRRPLSILQVGPVGLITISKALTKPEAVANIYEDGLKPNEVLPRNYAVQRVVFISKNLVPGGKDATMNPRSILDALGNFRIVASKLEHLETVTVTNPNP